MDDVIRVGFAALRTQVGAQQAQIDALERLVLASLPGPREPVACQHEETEDIGSTWTLTRLRCTRCGEVIERATGESESEEPPAAP